MGWVGVAGGENGMEWKAGRGTADEMGNERALVGATSDITLY